MENTQQTRRSRTQRTQSRPRTQRTQSRQRTQRNEAQQLMQQIGQQQEEVEQSIQQQMQQMQQQPIRRRSTEQQARTQSTEQQPRRRRTQRNTEQQQQQPARTPPRPPRRTQRNIDQQLGQQQQQAEQSMQQQTRRPLLPTTPPTTPPSTPSLPIPVQQQRRQQPQQHSLMKLLRDLESPSNNRSKKQEIERNIIEIIGRREFNPNETNKKGESLLMYAITIYALDVITALIESGLSKPDFIMKTTRETALIYACVNGRMLENSAYEIINTGQSLPDHQDAYGRTALMYASQNGLANIVNELIETGNAGPELVDRHGFTALMFAVSGTRYADYSLMITNVLIATGHSNPGTIGINGETALELACMNWLDECALAIVKTNESKPDHIFTQAKPYPTALIFACANNWNEVALALIATGQSIPDYVDSDGQKALDYAMSNDMREVIELLSPDSNGINAIDIFQEGFNAITQERMQIKDYINISPNNLVFMINGNYYLSSKREIKTQYENKNNIKHGCFEAGENVWVNNELTSIDYTDESNIDFNKEYFTLSSLFGMQIVVKTEEIESILDCKYASQLYIVESTGVRLPAIISQAYINGSGGVSADHCQTGKATDVYTIKIASSTCGTELEETKEETKQEEEKEDDNLLNQVINILYKARPYSFSINQNNTIGDVKNMLLNKLIADNDATVNSLNFNVNFIFKGRVYKEDSNNTPLSTLENPPYGITLQAMISPKVGGKKRRTRKLRNRLKKDGKLDGARPVFISRHRSALHRCSIDILGAH